MKAVIDIGTNSVRLLVAELVEGIVRPYTRLTKITRIGRGVDAAGALPQDGMERTLGVLKEFKELIPAQVAVQVLATSAVRDASNQQEFASLVREQTGWELRVLSGQEEAKLSFRGAVLALPIQDLDYPVSVVDIGGGSTEIFTGDHKGNLLGGGSVQVGAVRMLERFITNHPLLEGEWLAMEQEIGQLLAPLVEDNLQCGPKTLLAVGGTATSLAAMIQELPQFDYEKVGGFSFSYQELVDLYRKLGKLSLKERSQIPSLQLGREDVIISGTSILVKTMELLGFEELIVSIGDLLYGSL
ncbi:MAG: Ppx/GppA family phosphatase [Firmicutes bacterium]|nr:Ppx/GppA family phosphatase [Bacillota bacterium]